MKMLGCFLVRPSRRHGPLRRLLRLPLLCALVRGDHRRLSGGSAGQLLGHHRLLVLRVACDARWPVFRPSFTRRRFRAHGKGGRPRLASSPAPLGQSLAGEAAGQVGPPSRRDRRQAGPTTADSVGVRGGENEQRRRRFEEHLCFGETRER